MTRSNKTEEKVWKSYVWHGDACFFVSTIVRSYSNPFMGEIRGFETIVWRFDWDANERLDLLHQAAGVSDHQRICRCIIAFGEFPDEANPKHSIFFK